MINIRKHTVQLGTGDVNISILESQSGKPVLAFTNEGEEIGQDSIFMGFSNGESIDAMISYLKELRRTYYPQKKHSLSTTQQFHIFGE